MRIQNVFVYGRDFRFHPGSVAVRDGKFSSVDLTGRPAGENKSDGELADGGGAYLIPGLIDLHFHGAVGADVCDAREEALAAIAAYELSVGVTSICPATMTLPVSELNRILAVLADYADEVDALYASGEAAKNQE